MNSVTFFFGQLEMIINTLIVAVIVFVIVLMLLRLALNYADLNPFGRSVMFVRRLTDPLIMPVRRALVGFGFNPNFAPLVTILIAILLGYIAWELTDDVIGMLYGVIVSAHDRRPVALVGWLLYGLLGIYALLIFARIIFAWGQVSYANRIMRFLVRTTEPVLGPLRRLIPPLGVYDISPIVAFFIIWLLQRAIAGTLLRF
jgi:YggT family protein